MKKITASVALSLIICAVFSIFANAGEVERMTDKLIRIHVIANSDSEEDQALKLKVRDSVLAASWELFNGVSSKEEALEIIGRSLPAIQTAAEKTLAENGSEYSVSCSLSKTAFPQRVYDDFTLPAGEYDSVCVRIGEAAGKNWWCVCYPNLCVGAAMKIDRCETFTDEELIIVRNPQKARYKLWCFEAVRKLKELITSP